MSEIVNKENYAMIEALEAKREEFKLGGGEAAIERLMHSKGKLTIRERIDLLFDEGTFAPHETRKRLIQQLDILSTKNRDMCFNREPKKRKAIRPV